MLSRVMVGNGSWQMFAHGRQPTEEPVLLYPSQLAVRPGPTSPTTLNRPVQPISIVDSGSGVPVSGSETYFEMEGDLEFGIGQLVRHCLSGASLPVWCLSGACLGSSVWSSAFLSYF